MARYKVSNKNVYGLKSGAFATFGICIPVVMVLALIVEFFIAPLLYAGLMGNTVPEGAAGSVAPKGTPKASSIADMERLTDGFTFLTTGTVLNNDTVRVGETEYHYIELESGEKVFAHINKKALTKSATVGIYLLPVGVWREWTMPEELKNYPWITDTSHYIDMYGGGGPTSSPAAFERAIGSSAVAWLYVLVLLIFRIVGVRKWRFAPAFLASRDPLLPRNDLECWCAATFAIWSHSCQGMEGFPLVTGSRGTRKQVKSFRESLAEQWDIHNKKEGLQTVHELTDEWTGVLDARESGWDLCRATQLLGMMYLVGMLTRDELDQEFSRAGRVIQRCFSSWDGLVESYLDGFGAWVAQTGRDAEGNVAFRRGIYERLKRQNFSAYSIPWDTDLSWLPGVSGGDRIVTKQLLKHYRGDF